MSRVVVTSGNSSSDLLRVIVRVQSSEEFVSCHVNPNVHNEGRALLLRASLSIVGLAVNSMSC